MADAEQITRHIQELSAQLVRGRRIVVICAVLAGATSRVAALKADGAGDVLVLCLGQGTGDLPAPDEAEWVICPSAPISTVADEIRVWQQFVDQPPAEALHALQTFDPTGDAVAVTLLPVTLEEYAGRESWGGRPAAYTALEDKTLSQQIWDAAGVASAPEEVVDVTPDALRDSAARLDRGAGTVWSADASDGMNGGADRVFWVCDEEQAHAAYAELKTYAERARLMPFLDGVPCSIHGIVLADGVVVLRPVELIVLRQPGSSKFLYYGMSTTWDPADADREVMRDVARRVGTYLQREHDYRGAFGIDGIMTADGFRPHELNPRFSGGISTIGKGLPDLPLNRLHDMLVRGVDIGVPAADLERVLVDAADASRFASAHTVTHRVHPTATGLVYVAGSPAGLDITLDEEAAVGSLELGPHAAGGLVRFMPADPQPGERLAPWAAAALQLADRIWSTGFGTVEVAPDLR